MVPISPLVGGRVGYRKLECAGKPDSSVLGPGEGVLSWKKGVEQSGFVWCNPPELLPTPWDRGGLWQDKLRTCVHVHTGSSLAVQLRWTWAHSVVEGFTACLP